MIDSNSLSEFVKAPDANEIMTAFVSIPAGPVRAALVSHLATMAMVSLGEPQSNHQSDPDEPSERPFFSETAENRVVERRLRGQSVDEIAAAEQMEADIVRDLLVAAKSEGVQVGRIEGLKRKSPTKPEVKVRLSTKDIKARRKLCVELRMLGMGPAQIAKRIGITPSNVSGAIREARTRDGVVFPEVNTRMLWNTPLDQSETPAETPTAPPMPDSEQVQAS